MRPIPATLLACAPLLACSAEDSAAPATDGDRPNVILITLDTTRADYLSAYGYPEETSPNLDRLAEEGTRFDLAISTAAVTPVSHAAILSGRFNREHGVRVIFAASGFKLPEEVPTLATAAKDAGYNTLAVHSAFPVSPYFGLTRGFDQVESFSAEMTEEEDTGKAKWDQQNTRRSDDTTRIVLRKLKKTSGPFLLWVHYWDPHDPLQIPEPSFMPPEEELFEMENGKFVLEGGQKVMKRPAKSLYAAEIRYMDAQIGRLIAYLKESGRYDNTIIAVIADHGQGLGDHGWAAHRILYQEQIRVPLIVRAPGAEQKPSVSELVRSVDVAPTLLDYAGIEAPEGMSGRSLRPLMEGGADEPRLTFAEQINLFDSNAHMVTKRPHDDFLYCAMDAGWKLVYRPTNPQLSELFHIAEDPKELTNLYALDHPEAIRLKKELGRHVPWVTEPVPAEGGGEGAALAMKRLEELGYVDSEGESADVGPMSWEWVCPEHADQRAEELGRCSTCSSPLILVAAGK
jgi:arylsulfatase A-like enzyme